MNNAFPLAEVEPTEEALRELERFELPDENDRHVLAAALVGRSDGVVHRERV